MDVSRKQNMSNFPKNEHFIPPDTHIYVYPLLKYFKSAIKIFYKLSQITKLYLIGCLKMWDRSSKGILLIINT